jgi:hypothetical protein
MNYINACADLSIWVRQQGGGRTAADDDRELREIEVHTMDEAYIERILATVQKKWDLVRGLASDRRWRARWLLQSARAVGIEQPDTRGTEGQAKVPTLVVELPFFLSEHDRAFVAEAREATEWAIGQLLGQPCRVLLIEPQRQDADVPTDEQMAAAYDELLLQRRLEYARWRAQQGILNEGDGKPRK